MSDPFLGEIRMFGFSFAPRGWAQCNGELLPIEQNQSLYSVLGTTYGGDGRTEFSLPDLRGRAPVHVGTGFSLGSKQGEEGVSLSGSEIPSHTHGMIATNASGTASAPTGALLATTGANLGSIYSSAQNVVSDSLAASAITSNSGGQAHNNMQPYLTINFCINLDGTFPARN